MAGRIDHFPAEIEALPDFDGPFDAHRLAAEGCDVLFATYPAGTVIEPHTHPSNNVGVITKGRLILTIDGVESTYDAGDLVSRPGRGRARRPLRDRQRRDRALVRRLMRQSAPDTLPRPTCATDKGAVAVHGDDSGRVEHAQSFEADVRRNVAAWPSHRTTGSSRSCWPGTGARSPPRPASGSTATRRHRCSACS